MKGGFSVPLLSRCTATFCGVSWIVPQLLNEGAGQRPGSGNAGKGKEGAAWHRKAVCVASVFAKLSPGGDCGSLCERTAVEELESERTRCGCVCVSPEV